MSKKIRPHLLFCLLLVLVLIADLIIAYINLGGWGDMQNTIQWADTLWFYPLSDFYDMAVQIPYPPLFLYILYLIQLPIRLLRITDLHLICLIFKLPAILCDLLTATLLYRFCQRQTYSLRRSLLLSCAYLLNPAVWVNSLLWGQVDSCFTLFLVWMCIALYEERFPTAYVAFGIGLMLKQQMLLYAPILLLGILDQLLPPEYTPKKLQRNLFYGISVLLGMIVLSLPYGLGTVISRYLDTLRSFPVISVNAYNFWAMLGYNLVYWQEHTFSLADPIWGRLLMLFLLALSFGIGLCRRRDRRRYPLIAASFIICSFTFGTAMHERYLFSAPVLLLLSSILFADRLLLFLYTVVSICSFLNVAHVLYAGDAVFASPAAPFIRLVSLATVAASVLFLGFLLAYSWRRHRQ